MVSGAVVTSMRTTAGSTFSRIERMSPGFASAVDGRAATLSEGLPVTNVGLDPSLSASATTPPATPPPTSAPTRAAINATTQTRGARRGATGGGAQGSVGGLAGGGAKSWGLDAVSNPSYSLFSSGTY